MRQLQEIEDRQTLGAKTWAADFLNREGESREFLGLWFESGAVHEAKKRRATQRRRRVSLVAVLCPQQVLEVLAVYHHQSTKHGKPDRNFEFIGEDKDRRKESLWRDTGIGSVLPGDTTWFLKYRYLRDTGIPKNPGQLSDAFETRHCGAAIAFETRHNPSCFCPSLPTSAGVGKTRVGEF
jgi:hypothetical protein